MKAHRTLSASVLCIALLTGGALFCACDGDSGSDPGGGDAFFMD